jgi:hypothetical protein
MCQHICVSTYVHVHVHAPANEAVSFPRSHALCLSILSQGTLDEYYADLKKQDVVPRSHLAVSEDPKQVEQMPSCVTILEYIYSCTFVFI